LYQLFTFPIVHIAGFVIFFGVVYAISRPLRFYGVDTAKTTIFFVFIFNTIGLLSATVDTLNIRQQSEALLYIHPLTVIILLAYLMEFIRKQAEISRRKSLAFSMVPLAIFLAFRVMFLG
jgi:uncharacterized PurR-regulated membrane protein YhhQ (DUF165 family)